MTLLALSDLQCMRMADCKRIILNVQGGRFCFVLTPQDEAELRLQDSDTVGFMTMGRKSYPF